MFKVLRTAVLGLTLAFAVSGCADDLAKLKAGYNAVTSGATSPTAMVLGRSAFNTAEVLATNYTRLPRCTGSNGPICRDPSIRAPLDDAVRTGRNARNQITAFMRNNPGQPGPQDVYNALLGATDTIKRLTADYRAATGQ